MRAQGYSAGEDQVRRVVNAWRTDPHNHGNQPTIAAPPAREEVPTSSVRKTRWLLWKPGSDLTDREACSVSALTGLCPQIADAPELLTTFRALVTERRPEHVDLWLEQCERSDISELVGVAQGLRRDYAAVKAALRYEWNQGCAEGAVNRLKTLKRQMYARAGFALLRRRVLTPPARAP